MAASGDEGKDLSNPLHQFSPKWIVVLPPEGAARQVGIEISKAFTTLLPENHSQSFDCKKYLQAYDQLLKTDDQNIGIDLMNQNLMVQALDFGATHVLVMALSPITFFTAKLLQKQAVKTLHWFVEDYRSTPYWREIIGAYDIFFGIQRGVLEQACAEKHTRYFYLPTGATPLTIIDSSQVTQKFDIAFVGLPSYYRINILEFLLQEGLTLAIGGLGWDGYKGSLQSSIQKPTWLNAEESSTLLKSARIGLHLSYDNPALDRENTHLSPRHFDILQAGLPLLTEEFPLLNETLTGFSYVTFKNAAEALGEARKMLQANNTEEMLRVNSTKLNAEHTYVQRAKQILACA